MKHKGLPRGIEYQHVISIVVSADAVVLVLVALVVEAEVVRFILGGFLEASCARCAI
jgi:hypothetical protein